MSTPRPKRHLKAWIQLQPEPHTVCGKPTEGLELVETEAEVTCRWCRNWAGEVNRERGGGA
jgi:hypothetical protein